MLNQILIHEEYKWPLFVGLLPVCNLDCMAVQGPGRVKTQKYVRLVH
jgi:hypothetical protein